MSSFIGGLFVAIFGIFDKLFSFKKSEYFVELEDSTASTPKEKPVAKAAPAATPVTPEKSTTAAAVEPQSAADANGSESPVKEKKLAKQKEAAAAKSKKTEPVAAPTVAAAKPVAKPAAPTVTNFATDNLMPTPTSYRRRPGANMQGFKDMARQVKTPR